MRPEDKEELKSMSLGDHLEELRARLVLGLLGLFVGMIVCLFFGKTLIGVMSHPFEQEINELRKQKKVYEAPDGEEIKTSEQPQAVLVTHSDADGYRTYISHISIANLLSTLEKDPAEGKPDEAAKPVEANPGEAGAKETEPAKPAPDKKASTKKKSEGEGLQVQQAAVITHHPEKGFAVYATVRQVGEALEPLIDAGVLVESGPDQMGLPRATAVIVTQGPTEGFMVYMKTCLLFGILVTSPWLIWQIWSFVSAGLYRREKKYVHTVAPISGLLFVTGGMFFMLFVAPMMMKFLIRFDAAMGLRSFWSLQKYINMVFSLTLVFGAAFQMPIAIVFAERLGLVSLQTLTKNRKFVILGIVVIAAMATPPDPASQIALAIPLYGLYEASILICRIWRKRTQEATVA